MLNRVRTDFFFSSRRRHTRSLRDWSSDVCSSDLVPRWRILRPGGESSNGEQPPRAGLRRSHARKKIGRASCRERVMNLAVAVSVACEYQTSHEGQQSSGWFYFRSEERRVGKESRS